MWRSHVLSAPTAATPEGGVVYQLVVSHLSLVKVPLAWIIHHSTSAVDTVVVLWIHDGRGLLVPQSSCLASAVLISGLVNPRRSVIFSR